jgi:hypothetical protein
MEAMSIKTPGIPVSEFEKIVAEERRLQERKYQYNCPHKELLLAESILETEDGLRWHLCPKCFKKYSILKGFKVIQQQGPETIEVRKLWDRRSNGRLPF